MEQLIPWLYLKGVSTGDFSEALAALVGKDASGLSAPTVGRLKTVWQQDYQQWQKRSLEGKCMSISGWTAFTATYAWMINSASWLL